MDGIPVQAEGQSGSAEIARVAAVRAVFGVVRRQHLRPQIEVGTGRFRAVRKHIVGGHKQVLGWVKHETTDGLFEENCVQISDHVGQSLPHRVQRQAVRQVRVQPEVQSVFKQGRRLGRRGAGR